MGLKEEIKGFQHLGIPTENMEKTRDFYKGLGFEQVFSAYLEDTDQRVEFFKLGNTVLEVYDCGKAAMLYGAIDHVALDVVDIERVYEEICSKNMNNLNDKINFLPFWEKGVRFFTIEGPNKEKIEFSQLL